MTRKLVVSDGFFGRALIVAFLVLLLLKPAQRMFDDIMTPQPWFDVQISVPNHLEGEDPMVSYNRAINRPVYGIWAVTVYSRQPGQRFTYHCSGSDYAPYDPASRGTISMPFDEFVGKDCEMVAGQYRICVNYDLRDRSQTSRFFGPFCTEFLVQDREAETALLQPRSFTNVAAQP
jgi:hypothetical protein